MDYSKVIERLGLILLELDARDSSCNCVVSELLGKSWLELCDEGIELFKKLKDTGEVK